MWRDIKGYEGIYQVSDEGEIKSLKRFNPNSGKNGMWYPERLLSQKTDKDGYKIVALQKDRKRKDWKVHRLVLWTFNPIEDWEKLQVNHIDGDKSNNHITNLEWVTNSNNQKHRANVLKTGSMVGQNIKVTFIETGEGLNFLSISEASRQLGIPLSTLRTYAKNTSPEQVERRKYKVLVELV